MSSASTFHTYQFNSTIFAEGCIPFIHCMSSASTSQTHRFKFDYFAEGKTKAWEDPNPRKVSWSEGEARTRWPQKVSELLPSPLAR
ncbi:unnamed protein product, partial [Vitis vinifera]